ncbi:outer membrane protein insertion porin family [Mangrovibacterium marinum]|uniref:Outer membrane protein assembly factor BamA n=2 Tax=Mangrovibacterium marinum TaxID=1639118 RepID=A0A2T5C5E9_9BACT|nr:outer membrane protein insertion porin family [Mangrovibacterium marinum]
MQRRLILAAIFTLLLFFNSHVFAQENYEIRHINFVGNDSIDDDLLLDAMVMHPLSYIEKTFSKKEPALYNREMLETDLERLTRYYQREGFIDVSIELAAIKQNDQKKKVDLRFRIEQGMPFTIDSISISQTASSTAVNIDSVFRSVKAKLQLQPNSRFSDDALISDLNLLKNAFSGNGYAYTTADYQLSLNKDAQKVSIHYLINTGPLCHFGPTQLDGNKHTDDKFIRKQLLFSEGDIYSTSRIDESRQKLYKLQLFSILSIQPELTQQHDTPVPVKIYIKEAPRLSSKYGAGYGTEDKFRAFAELTYKGFPGDASRLKMQLKHSALRPYQVSLNWIQPQFLYPRLSLTVNPFISRNNEPGYKIQDMGLNVKLANELSDQLSAQTNYYLERVKTYDAEVDSLGSSTNDIPYQKSGFIFSVFYDSSEPKFSPTHGLNITLACKLNGYAFGGDYNYSRIWTDIRHYRKMGTLVLASRLRVGGIHSGDADHFIPVEDRFFAGGSNSIRGWQYSELGPLRDNGKPLGGSSVLEGAVELRIPLAWKLSVVSFLDFGNVWVDEFQYQLNELAYAGGGGLRFDTPIGPIRFDVGVPLWNEKRSAAFFISVGQAF